ncbi:MAG: LysE family translocator [Candidatus Promineifilaceae bacterium]
MLAFLLQGLFLGASAAVQPGPLQAYLLSLTTRYGWRRALPAAFAPLLSDGPVLLLTLLVLSKAPPLMLHALQIVGGLFLIYLAYSAFRVYRKPERLDAGSEQAAQQNFLKGALINLLSPNPYIFWATIAGPIFLEGWREAPLYGISFMTGFYVALIGGFIAFVALFALTGSLDPRLNKALNGLAAVALLVFGLFQLGRGMYQLISL